MHQVRKMYNLYVEDFRKQYKQFGKTISRNPSYFYKNPEYPYLADVDTLAYANVKIHFESAKKAFFNDIKKGKPAHEPTFKSKKNNTWSYTTNNLNNSIRIEDGRIKLPKIKQPIKIRMHRPLPENSTFSSVTITKNPAGQYFVTLCVTFQQEIPNIVLNPEMSIGLDYSQEHFFVDNQGNSPSNPHFFKRYMHKLAYLQQLLSKKKKNSHNYRKIKLKIAKLHEKISNCRDDFQWKLVNSIVNRDDVDMVFIETLDMKEQSQHSRKYGLVTFDNSWYSFTQKLDYKLKINGKLLVKIDKYFPSSQKCSCCGKIHPEMKDLKNRTLICECGLELDRDINASINIRNEGIRMFKSGEYTKSTVGTTGLA